MNVSRVFAALRPHYQIVQSITWNIESNLPDYFLRFMNLLSLFNFDFLSPDCLMLSPSNSVYIWTCVPVILSGLNFFVYKVLLNFSCV